jgi:hypothetical protein
MTGYQQFLQAKASLADKVFSLLPAPREDKPMHHLETVTALQSRVLTLAQLDAIGQIQQAVVSISKLTNAINQLAPLNSLPVSGLMLAEVGLLQHTLDGLLFDHNCAAAKLNNGGLPVHEGESELQRPVRSFCQEAAA